MPSSSRPNESIGAEGNHRERRAAKLYREEGWAVNLISEAILFLNFGERWNFSRACLPGHLQHRVGVRALRY